MKLLTFFMSTLLSAGMALAADRQPQSVGDLSACEVAIQKEALLIPNVPFLEAAKKYPEFGSCLNKNSDFSSSIKTLCSGKNLSAAFQKHLIVKNKFMTAWGENSPDAVKLAEEFDKIAPTCKKALHFVSQAIYACVDYLPGKK
jgi:hypothetical protein